MDVKKILGQRIKKYRKEQNITQEQLAEKINISTRALCGIELGENFLTAETLENISKVLNVEFADLFFQEKTKTKKEIMSQINNLLNIVESTQELQKIYEFIKFILIK